MRRRAAIGLIAALVLAHCGTSPETHYFTLAAVPGGGERIDIASPVTVAAVHLPPTLDRREMVRRSGANTVEISDQDRWTAPLGEMIRNVLSQDLADRVPKHELVLPDAPAPQDTAQIVVTVAQFGPDAQGEVTLDGSWSLIDAARSDPVLRRDVSLEARAPAGGASGQAAAMSQLLAELADGIASTLADGRR